MKIKIISLAALLLLCGWEVEAQKIAVKTNLFYAGATLTPNVGLELGTGGRTSLDFAAGYNPWNLNGTETNNKKMVHWLVQPEFRYWLCERFNGHFFGIHGLVSQYNVGEHKLVDLLQEKIFEERYRYEGFAYGGGISYGYHLMVGKRFGLEFNIGLGAAYLQHDKFNCKKCSDTMGKEKYSYVGITKAGLTLVFLIK